MPRSIFIELADGSFTELKLKIELSQHFGSSVEHEFCTANCRMLYLKNGIQVEQLVGIYQEIPGNESSKKFIDFLEKHNLRISKSDILGIVHPSQWSNKLGYRLNQDLQVLQGISEEFAIPILGGNN